MKIKGLVNCENTNPFYIDFLIILLVEYITKKYKIYQI